MERPTQHSAELVEVIRRIRNRWRLRLAARGAVIVFVGTVLALLVSARGLETLRFSAPSIVGFRLLALAVFGALVYYGIKPLRRMVTDTQVALYLEEHNPSLEAAILSAVETSSSGADASHSPRLAEKLVEQAIEQSRAVEHGMAIDRGRLRRHVASFAAFAAVAALLIALGPAYLRHGLSALLIFTSSPRAASPYSIVVTPGNKSVPRGGDQAVQAKLARLCVQGRDADAAQRNGRRIRAPAARRHHRSGVVRRHDVPPRQADGVLRRVERREVACLLADRRRPADRRSAGAGVPLPRLHEPAAAQGRQRRRRGGAARHERAAEGDADDEDVGRADCVQGRRRGAADGAGGRHARRQLHAEGAWLLQDRADGAEGRKGRRLAAVHDRRPQRSASHRGVQQARTGYRRQPGRGSLHRGQGARRLRDQGA